MFNSSGIGTYLKNIVPQIIELCPEFDFTILGNISELKNYTWAKDKNVNIVQFDAPIYSIAEQIKYKNVIPNNCDLFWSPNYNIPLQLNCKLLVTVCDLNHLALKQINYGLFKRLYARLMFNQVKKIANATIYISEFSKNEFNKYIGKPFADQFVTLLGINNDWYKIPLDKPINPKPFILYVGQRGQHKNFISLLKAYANSNILNNEIDIVAFGGGDFTQAELKLIQDYGINNKTVHHLSGDDNVLKNLYRNALLFCCPSLYEGFGLPILESMVCECPVICSNTSSLPEVAGDAALYFDPNNIETIMSSIEKIVFDSSLRSSLIRKGKERVKQFTWGRCAKETMKVYNEVV